MQYLHLKELRYQLAELIMMFMRTGLFYPAEFGGSLTVTL